MRITQYNVKALQKLSDDLKEDTKDLDLEAKAPAHLKMGFPRMTLSVACITKGEDTLWDMLGSIEGIVDEIIIVHSDKDYVVTLEGNSRKRHFYREWTDDFASAKNFAFERCTSDWVLWLDSDDIVDEESCKLIRAALDNPGPKTADKSCFFSFQVRMTNEQGHSSGICQPRMTPNLPGIKWQGRIHETHMQSLMDLKLAPVTVDNIYITHSGYDNQAFLYQKVKDRNIPMLLKEDDSPHKFYHLGQSEMILKDWRLAQEYFGKVLEYVTLQSEFRNQVLYSIAICEYERGDLDEAYRKFNGVNGVPESLYYRAIIEVKRGHYDEGAIELFEKYLAIEDKPSFWGTNRPACRFDAYNQICDLLLVPFKEVQQRARKEFPKK